MKESNIYLIKGEIENIKSIADKDTAIASEDDVRRIIDELMECIHSICNTANIELLTQEQLAEAWSREKDLY